MSRILGAVRGNPHALNYLLLVSVTAVPMLLYASKNSPSSDTLEATLRENFAPDVMKIAENTNRINNFWKAKRNSGEMDAVYSQLLRSGTGGLKRHHELSGTLAEIDAAQDAQAATLQRILAQPLTETERTAAATVASVSVDGTNTANTAVTVVGAAVVVEKKVASVAPGGPTSSTSSDKKI